MRERRFADGDAANAHGVVAEVVSDDRARARIVDACGQVGTHIVAQDDVVIAVRVVDVDPVLLGLRVLGIEAFVTFDEAVINAAMKRDPAFAVRSHLVVVDHVAFDHAMRDVLQPDARLAIAVNEIALNKRVA